MASMLLILEDPGQRATRSSAVFIVEVATRGEAVALAQSCPAAAWATVEVRALGPCFI